VKGRNIIAHLKVRGNKLYIRYFVNGVEKTKSTKLENTPKNVEIVKNIIIPQLIQKVENGYFEVKKSKVSYFAKLYLEEVEELKTYFEYQSRVESILAGFGDRDIREISVSELREWIKYLDMTPKTKKKYITNFKRIFQLAKLDGLIDINPFERIELPSHEEKEVKPFSIEEMQKLLSEVTGELRNFFGIAFNTGMRAGEIIGLTLSDIDFKKMTISINKSISHGKITTPKTKGSIRKIPLLKSAAPYFKDQIDKNNQSIYLFSRKGGTHKGDSSNMGALEFLRAKGYNHRVHDTRHTFISNMLNSGAIRLTDLAYFVGHSSTQMILKRYAKYIESEALEVDRNIDIYGYKIGYSANLKAEVN
jgi:integrase